MKLVNIGVVGATGAVGEAFLKLLKDRNFPVGNLKLFASENSLGQEIPFKNKTYKCEVLKKGSFTGLDLVFFSSGDEISKEWAPVAVEEGAYAVDNSAAFRMSPEHKLIVPEVNGHLLKKNGPKEIIANPNCSTIQLVVALAPLEKTFGIESVNVATYQSVSGAGKEGREELLTQVQQYLEGQPQNPKVFSHPIAFNSIPQIGSFNEMGFSSEEMKIMLETRKIMGLSQLSISAFTVRVPTLNAHSEAVWVKLKKEFSLSEAQASLKSGEGLEFVPQDTPKNFPVNTTADGKYPVYVGRVHKDQFSERTLLMWVVADNLYKGAALNGIQIAERLFN
jgi:aspartate-semialdehyde dehydrogenase